MPVVTNIQESGDSDLKVSGNGCRLATNQRIKMRSKSRCSMSVSVLVPGFKPSMKKISYVVGDKEYQLVPVSQYND